jgi:hypothetical protein
MSRKLIFLESQKKLQRVDNVCPGHESGVAWQTRQGRHHGPEKNIFPDTNRKDVW